MALSPKKRREIKWVTVVSTTSLALIPLTVCVPNNPSPKYSTLLLLFYVFSTFALPSKNVEPYPTAFQSALSIFSCLSTLVRPLSPTLPPFRHSFRLEASSVGANRCTVLSSLCWTEKLRCRLALACRSVVIDVSVEGNNKNGIVGILHFVTLLFSRLTYFQFLFQERRTK